jgi:hypothetical protein
MAETKLGQSAHALPQPVWFWENRSGKVKNFKTGLVQVHRRYTIQITSKTGGIDHRRRGSGHLASAKNGFSTSRGDRIAIIETVSQSLF